MDSRTVALLASFVTARSSGPWTSAVRKLLYSSQKVPDLRLDCSSLTDLAVLELGTLPQLQRLAASGLPYLTDNALFFLAEHAESLLRLHVCQCRRLTLDAIHVLVRKLNKLEHLNASGVPALKRAGVERFSDKPSVVSVHTK